LSGNPLTTPSLCSAATRLPALIESTPDLIGSVDINYHLVAFNHAVVSVLKRNVGVPVLAFWLALSGATSAQQYAFRALRQADGLSNLSINDLAMDREGFLWVGTENGVYRFLGSSFERYGLEGGLGDVDVRDVVADPEGTVWVGTEKDLYRWDGRRFVPAGQHPIQIVGARHIALEDARHLLIVDKGKLYRLEHSSDGQMISYSPVVPESLFATYPGLQRIVSVSVLRTPFRDGEIWIGSDERLYSLSRKLIEGRIPAERGGLSEWGKSKGIPEEEWESVVLDKQGTLWAAGLKHIAILRPDTEHFADRSIPGSDHGSTFGHAPILEDPQGRILASAGQGVARWNGKEWQFIGRENGLTRINSISGLIFDNSGDLFLAGRGDGVYEWLGYADWQAWGSEQSLPSTSIWSILLSRSNRVFLGTENGPAWIDVNNGRSAPLPLQGKWTWGRVAALGENGDGTLWAAVFPGAFLRIDLKSGKVTQIAKLPGPVLTGFQSPNGQVFIFTRQGVYIRQAWNAKAVPQRLASAEKALGEPSAIQSVQSGCSTPDGSVWLVGNNRIVRSINGEWTAPPISGLPSITGTLLGLACTRDGSVWVTGDETGTWHLRPQGNGLQASQLVLPPEFSTLSGLTIHEDQRGWIWIGTDVGYVAWNGKNWRHITEESGLIWNDTNQGVLQEAPDGSLWMGTSAGVSHLLNPEDVFDPVPMSINFTGMKRGTDDLLGATHVTMQENGSPLRLQVSSPTMRNRSELIFKERLIGLRPVWEDTKEGGAILTTLRAGSYSFAAMACNPGLSACSAPVSIDIKVLPPWYRTFWFLAPCFLVVVVLGWFVIRFYVRHLRRRGEVLEGLVTERTRELETSRELLKIQATHDGLTGFLNRSAVLSALADEMERARRKGISLVLALIDLDHFKRVNDERGHLVGDEALRRFAAAVNSSVRPYDRCGRYGGEEFLIVLPDMPPELAEHRLESLHAAITNVNVDDGASGFKITCSIGAVVAPPSPKAMVAEQLLAIADEALYEAKSAGRNRVKLRVFNENPLTIS